MRQRIRFQHICGWMRPLTCDFCWLELKWSMIPYQMLFCDVLSAIVAKDGLVCLGTEVVHSCSANLLQLLHLLPDESFIHSSWAEAWNEENLKNQRVLCNIFCSFAFSRHVICFYVTKNVLSQYCRPNQGARQEPTHILSPHFLWCPYPVHHFVSVPMERIARSLQTSWCSAACWSALKQKHECVLHVSKVLAVS